MVKNGEAYITDRFSPAAMALQKEWVTLALDLLSNRITGPEFEKRKKELEIRSLKVEKTHKAGEVPGAVKAAVNIMGGSAVLKSEHGCPPEKL